MHDDKTRLRRLCEILQKLDGGQLVQNRALQAWLTQDEYSHFETRVAEQSELRETLKIKPIEVVQYERLLKRAILLDSRTNRYTGKAAYDARTRALAACERALEHLQQFVDGKGHLEQWFDRPVTCPPGGELSADPHAMPIPITSKSSDLRPNMGYAALLRSNRQLKREAVVRAIETLLQQDDPAFNDALAQIVAHQRHKKIKGVFDD